VIAVLRAGGALLAFALLYLPLLTVMAYSFNAGRYGYEWKGFTLRWYGQLGDERIVAATWHSLALAVGSTIGATPLGTMLAIGLKRAAWRPRMRTFAEGLVNLPIVTPDITFAAALAAFFLVLRQLLEAIGVRIDWLTGGLLPMGVGHVTFQVSYVALVVAARLAAIGPEQEEAARDLYASSWVFHRRVLLPQLMPAIAAGAIMAFILSLDDFMIAFLLNNGPGSLTLPVLIQASTRNQGATILALSTLVFAGAVVLVAAFAMLARPSPSGDHR
jgi:spermidine/putrescine transport system permease protein